MKYTIIFQHGSDMWVVKDDKGKVVYETKDEVDAKKFVNDIAKQVSFDLGGV